MRVIHHVNLLVLVLLTSCSRSSPPAQRAQTVSNEVDTAHTARQPAVQPPSAEETVGDVR